MYVNIIVRRKLEYYDVHQYVISVSSMIITFQVYFFLL